MVASLARHIWPRAQGEHVTVALIPPVADQLGCLQKTTGMSVTDLINRAITSYAFLDEQMRVGNDVMVRDNWTEQTRLVRFALRPRSGQARRRAPGLPAAGRAHEPPGREAPATSSGRKARRQGDDSEAH
jgi:hypothetical protein